MKAITFDPSTDQFSMSELPIPQVGGNDVLIKVDASGLDPVDAKIASWKSMQPDMDSAWVKYKKH